MADYAVPRAVEIAPEGAVRPVEPSAQRVMIRELSGFFSLAWRLKCDAFASETYSLHETYRKLLELPKFCDRVGSCSGETRLFRRFVAG